MRDDGARMLDDMGRHLCRKLRRGARIPMRREMGEKRAVEAVSGAGRIHDARDRLGGDMDRLAAEGQRDPDAPSFTTTSCAPAAR